MEEAINTCPRKPHLVVGIFVILVLIALSVLKKFDYIGSYEVMLVCFLLSSLIILYFVVLLIFYALRRKILGPIWLIKVVATILILIIIVYFVFPALASPWLMMLGGILGVSFRFQ